MKFKISNSWILQVLFLILVISIAGLSRVFDYQRVVTFGLMPFMLIYLTISTNNKFIFLKYREIKLFVIIILWSFVLISVAKNYLVALDELKKMIGSCIAMLLAVEFIKMNPVKHIKWLFITYLIAFYVLVFILYTNTGLNVDIYSRMDRSNEALGINANRFAYFSYFAISAVFYLNTIKKKKIYLLLSIITVILSGYVAFVAVSRQGIIFPILLSVGYWLFVFKSKSEYRKVYYFGIILVLLYALFYLYNIYDNSYLQARMLRATDSDNEPRINLMLFGFKLFLENPITGVGPGQYIIYEPGGHFSHNSYVESATNTGIIGLIAWLWIVLKPYVRSFKSYFNRRLSVKMKELNRMHILFFGSFILYNNFYVFYLTIYAMMFFVIILSIQRYYIDYEA